MKPVMQTKFGEGVGNCFNACLASLLEWNLEDIPEFQCRDWLKKVDKFLQPYGYTYIEFDMDVSSWTWFGECYCLACGESPRELMHAVIAKHVIKRNGQHKFEFVHDPHPDGGWVKTEHIGFLLPTWKSDEEK